MQCTQAPSLQSVLALPVQYSSQWTYGYFLRRPTVMWRDTRLKPVISFCFFSKAFKNPHLSNSSTPCHLEQMWSHNNPSSVIADLFNSLLPGVEYFPLYNSTTFPKGVQVRNIYVVFKSFLDLNPHQKELTQHHWGVSCREAT